VGWARYALGFFTAVGRKENEGFSICNGINMKRMFGSSTAENFAAFSGFNGPS